MTNSNTFRELHQRAILETCDLWDIWSEWWGDMTWPKKRQWQRQRQRQRQIQLENTFRERSKRLVTFETFDQSDEETWTDQKKDKDKYKENDNDNYVKRTPSKSNPRDLWPLRQRQIQQPWQTHDMACEPVWNFRQLRTWIHTNHCDLTIKSDTGRHSQFLRCFY